MQHDSLLPRLSVTGLAIAISLSCATRRASSQEPTERTRPRARDIGVTPGRFDPGPLNAITDVGGVRVGHVTVIEGDDVRTGATVIVPHDGDLFREKVPAAVGVMNGFGKLVGYTQIAELGQLETPIFLTNTLAVWDAANALVAYTLERPGNEEVRSVNPVVGETNDGWLNEIRKRSLTRDHFRKALAAASAGAVAEGSVGAGTGTHALGFKGGIGTSSRRLPDALGGYTIGVLVQTNFGGDLTIAGIPMGELLAHPARDDARDGSCMIVVATDAPLDAHQLERLARRAFAGMARTGASFSHDSGDYAIAFSVAKSMRIPHARKATTASSLIHDEARLSPLFEASADATEEAISNSLFAATTINGRDGHATQALPIDEVRRILHARRR